MRARIEFPLTALTLLFLLHGLAALVSTLFALVSDALFQGRATAWLQLLLPVAALLAPALPLARFVGRERLLAAAAAVAALARLALWAPSFPARWLAGALLVAAGATFLSAAVGLLDRRAIASGAAAALLGEQLLRYLGGSWDLLLQPRTPLLAIALLTAVHAALAGYWLLEPRTRRTAATLERRRGGMRLRGAIAFGCVLFLELTLLGRPAVGARLSGVPYPVLALLHTAVSAAAVLVLARRTLPVASYRAITVGAALLAGIAATFASMLHGYSGALLLLAGHAAALMLLVPAFVPAGGSRRGWTLAVAPVVFAALTALHAFTFFGAFTIPALHGHGAFVIAAAGALAALMMLLLPRPLPAPPRHALQAAAVAGAALLVAGVHAARNVGAYAAAPAGAGAQHAPRAGAHTDPPPGDRLRVATWNVHLGYSQDWRFDPARIAATIAESGAQVVALQEAPAGLAVAYGIDLPLWLARELGMHEVFAPSSGRLFGNALLSKLALEDVTTTPLPAPAADPRRLVRARLRDAGVVAGTHFGLDPRQQPAQAQAAIDALADAPRAVLLGDLNARPASPVAALLQAAGFRDVFEVSGVRAGPTWPARQPLYRIDWVWVRGYDVAAAGTSAGGGADHRLVHATLVLSN